MKIKIHIFIVTVAAMGCMDVNLLDDMMQWDTDTGLTGVVLDSGTVVSGPPEVDTSDVGPPILTSVCVETETEMAGGCGINGNASLHWRCSTDEPAVVAGTSANIEILTMPWQTEHELVIRKSDVPQQIAVSVSDVNGNVLPVTLNMTETVNPAIVITEVLADCVGPEPGGEYVKIANVGNAAADLSGWMIDDNSDRNGDLISEGTALPAGEVATIAMTGFLGAEGVLISLNSSIGSGGLKNSESESIQLFDANGVPVDEYLNLDQLPREGVPFIRRHPLLPLTARNLWIYGE